MPRMADNTPQRKISSRCWPPRLRENHQKKRGRPRGAKIRSAHRRLLKPRNSIAKQKSSLLAHVNDSLVQADNSQKIQAQEEDVIEVERMMKTGEKIRDPRAGP